MVETPPIPKPAPPCPGPAPDPHGPARYTVPPGAVDTHAHVIGLPPDYPFVDNRAYTPPAAPPSAYLGMLDGTGMTHGVLIQVSVHGSDNRLMLETLRANRQRLRGIAVAPLGLSDKTYRDMQQAGVVGLRLNVLFGGGIGLERLDDYGALCRELGWHLQFLVGTRHLTPIAARLGKLPVPFIVDHMGHPSAADGVQDKDFQTLVSLVRDGGWVKLSGAFRHRRRPALSRHHSAGAGTARGRARPLCMGLGLAARRDLAAQTHAQCRRIARRTGRLGARRSRAQARAGGQSGAAVRVLTSRARVIFSWPSRDGLCANPPG